MQHKSDAELAHDVAQRVSRAVRQLATGRGDVRDRLRVAGQTLLPLQLNEFPKSLQQDFKWVMDQLTRYDALGSEGRIEATMRRIQNVTGEKIAQRIVAIYDSLRVAQGLPPI